MIPKIGRPRLSSTRCGEDWLSQFTLLADRAVARRMLDEIFLMNEEDVSRTLRGLITKYCNSKDRSMHYIALFAEREMPEKYFFDSKLIADRDGKLRTRAIGRNGRNPVKPIRGSSRVGSEGPIAFLVSQLSEAPKSRIKNHPGPDRIRAKSTPVRTIGIVTDFIGSGSRVVSLLNKLWAVPSVKSWISSKRVKITVFAAIGTMQGIAMVKSHRTGPMVYVHHIAPTLFSNCSRDEIAARTRLLSSYGSSIGRGSGVLGFKDSAALVGFSYRLPNNLPPIFTEDDPVSGWKALFRGPVPEHSAAAFSASTLKAVVAGASETLGIEISDDLDIEDAVDVLVLQAIRGRWRPRSEIALSEMTGVPVPRVLAVRERAIQLNRIDAAGRLTDIGQALVNAGSKRDSKRPTIPTNPDSYYPTTLRTPRSITSLS